MMRIYISKISGDGLTLATAYRALWRDVIGDAKNHGAVDSKYGFWIGQIDTTDAQHDLLVADTDNIRWINHASLDIQFNELTQIQKDKAVDIVAFLGFEQRDVLTVFAGTAKVRDLLNWLIGRACWMVLRDFD